MKVGISLGLSTASARVLLLKQGSNVLPSPLPFPLNSAHFCFLHPLLFCFKARLKAAKELVHVEGAFALRSGEWLHIDSACIVSGDVLRIEEGEIVPADGSVVADKQLPIITVDVTLVDPSINSVVSDGHLLCGFRILDIADKGGGGCVLLRVTSTGRNTVVGKLMESGNWLVGQKHLEVEEQGMNLL